MLKSNALKEKILNNETNQKIAELQEENNAEERERQNQLLNAQLDVQKNRLLVYIIGLIGLSVLAIVIGFALNKNRKKNTLISAQNLRLSELNAEKNHLMSIVSHDLSSPFTAIKLWAQHLKTLDQTELEEAKEMIVKTSDFGLNTIKKILTIDKNELQNIEIKEIDIAELIGDLKGRFDPLLNAKNQTLKIELQQLSFRRGQRPCDESSVELNLW